MKKLLNCLILLTKIKIAYVFITSEIIIRLK